MAWPSGICTLARPAVGHVNIRLPNPPSDLHRDDSPDKLESNFCLWLAFINSAADTVQVARARVFAFNFAILVRLAERNVSRFGRKKPLRSS